MTFSHIKYFFVYLCCLYICQKNIKIRFKPTAVPILLIFSASASLFTTLIHQYAVGFTAVSVAAAVFAFCLYLKKGSVTLCANLSVLSTAFSFLLFLLATVALIPAEALIFYCLRESTISEELSHILSSISAGMTQVLLSVLFFRIKRFRNGFSQIEKNFSDQLSLLISLFMLLALSFIYVKDDDYQMGFLIVFIILIFGIIMYMWWKKNIKNAYLHKSSTRTIDILEHTVSKQEAENKKLASLIHKDNKLISAIELATRELCQKYAGEESAVLLREIDKYSKERDVILNAPEDIRSKNVAKTNVFSTDMTVSYLFGKALNAGAGLSVSVTGDVRYMADTIASESDLNTLIADLTENAIIAVSGAEKKNILLVIGMKDTQYCLDVFDSGAPFETGVFTNMGKKQYTTHKDTGGSGIGLTTTYELLDKYHASFEIEELYENHLYTKRVSVTFDCKNETRIYSDRIEVSRACERREDVKVIPVTAH